MAYSRKTKIATCLDGADSTGWGTTIDVRGFRHIILQFGTTNSTNATTKFAGSVSETAPTFSSAASPTNHWDYVGSYDLEDGAFIDGDTGIALTGTDDVRNLLINVEGLEWLNCNVTAYSAGNITVAVRAYDNT